MHLHCHLCFRHFCLFIMNSVVMIFFSVLDNYSLYRYMVSAVVLQYTCRLVHKNVKKIVLLCKCIVSFYPQVFCGFGRQLISFTCTGFDMHSLRSFCHEYGLSSSLSWTHTCLCLNYLFQGFPLEL